MNNIKEIQLNDLPKYYECSDYQIYREGKRLWVNGPNGLIARYGPRGIDIHNEDGLCVECKPFNISFVEFCSLLNKHWSINLKELIHVK